MILLVVAVTCYFQWHSMLHLSKKGAKVLDNRMKPHANWCLTCIEWCFTSLIASNSKKTLFIEQHMLIGALLVANSIHLLWWKLFGHLAYLLPIAQHFKKNRFLQPSLMHHNDHLSLSLDTITNIQESDLFVRPIRNFFIPHTYKTYDCCCLLVPLLVINNQIYFQQ